MKGNKRFKVQVEGTTARGAQYYDALIKIEEYLSQHKSKKQHHELKSDLKVIRFEKKLIQKEYPEEKIPSLIEDLLNIALATFSADKIVERDIKVNSKRVEDRYFTRKIKISISVSDVEHWEKVRHQLEKTISFMTYDIFKFKFTKKRTKITEIKQKNDEYDSVSLFSGGLDSLAGSFYLPVNGFNPLFVSINHAGIKKIVEQLYGHLSDDSTRILGVNPKFKSKEYTQFSRSFLYLTTAVSFALAHKKAKNIFIPENGIIARQIGMMEGRHGTRTAHPRFLMYYTDLINQIFPDFKLKIKNPFTYFTKREIVKKIQDTSLIEKTVSCAHTMFLKKSHGKPEHCGMGIPCLIRTISLISSGIITNEENLNLKFNPFLIDFKNPEKESNVTEDHTTINRWYRDGLVNVLDLIRLSLEIDSLSKNESIVEHSEFLNDKVYSLYRRFSKNVLYTIDHYKKENPSLEGVINKFKS